MDALAEAQRHIAIVTEIREGDADALLAIAWGLVAVCERMDRWLDMQEPDAVQLAPLLQDAILDSPPSE